MEGGGRRDCRIFYFLLYQMFSSAKAEEEPAWTGFAMEQIMKTLSFVNSSLVQAPREEKEKLAHKLDDTLYCAKVGRPGGVERCHRSLLITISMGHCRV